MAREVSTTEALMTDPTTPEGAAYWQERHDYERRLEDADYVDAHLTAELHDRPVSDYLAPSMEQKLLAELRRIHPPHHDVEGCRTCGVIRRASVTP
jgi:hypothetical protein